MIGKSQFLPALDIVIGLEALDGVLNQLWVVQRITCSLMRYRLSRVPASASGFVTMPGFGSKTSQYSAFICHYTMGGKTVVR